MQQFLTHTNGRGLHFWSIYVIISDLQTQSHLLLPHFSWSMCIIECKCYLASSTSHKIKHKGNKHNNSEVYIVKCKENVNIFFVVGWKNFLGHKNFLQLLVKGKIYSRIPCLTLTGSGNVSDIIFRSQLCKNFMVHTFLWYDGPFFECMTINFKLKLVAKFSEFLLWQ